MNADHVLNQMPSHDQVLMVYLARPLPGLPHALLGGYAPLRERMLRAGVVREQAGRLRLTPLGARVARLAASEPRLVEQARMWNRLADEVLAAVGR